MIIFCRQNNAKVFKHILDTIAIVFFNLENNKFDFKKLIKTQKQVDGYYRLRKYSV